MKRKVIAAILCAAVLSGCGSSHPGISDEVWEQAQSDYNAALEKAQEEQEIAYQKALEDQEAMISKLMGDGADQATALPEQDEPETEDQDTQEEETEEMEPEMKSMKSGSYDMDDMHFTFRDHVNDDVTGKWRLAQVATGTDVLDYAADYHGMFFSSDDEIHAVINRTLNVTSRLSFMSPNMLFVDCYEYKEKEEHSAKDLFGGMKLGSFIVYTDTDEVEDLSAE